MQIKELRLSGFKSFLDPVRVAIDAGLTGIVGPNGCGKSNLLEAVRWAMGAASAKAMRAGDMDDVIFAGADGRPAREFAEVVLVMDAGQITPPPQIAPADTFEVSRRIKREVGSTYRVNGKEVRAKDVQLLFADSSTGANSPALVRQGQISELIAAKPENRRRVLEEAAGIAGLHARRHEADLKLNAALVNLARLDEVTGEIQAQIAGLSRQAKQAERYRNLAQDLRRHEALLFHRRIGEAGQALHSSEADWRSAERDGAQQAHAASQAARESAIAADAVEPLREQALIAAAILRRQEGERVGLMRDLQEARAALARMEAAIARAQDDQAREQELAIEADTALQRLQADHASLAAQDEGAAIARAHALARDAEARCADAERTFDAEMLARSTHGEHVARASERLNAAQAQSARTAGRVKSLGQAIGEIQDTQGLDTHVQRNAALLGRAVAELETLRARVSEGESELRKAEALARAGEQAWREREHARLVLAAEAEALQRLTLVAKKAFAPILADIEVEPGFERALAAALGAEAEGSLTADAPLHWAGAALREIAWPDGVSPLREQVRAPGVLAARLAFCGWLDQTPTQAMVDALHPGARLVTRAGDLFRWDGFVRRANASDATAVRLEQKNRLASVAKNLRAADDAAQQARAALEEANKKRTAAEEALHHARAALRSGEMNEQAARKAHDLAEADAARNAARRADLEGQMALAMQEHAEAANALTQAQDNVSALAPFDEAPLQAARANLQAMRQGAADARSAATLADRARHTRVQRLEAISVEQAAWKKRQAAARARLAAFAKSAAGHAQDLAQAQAAPALAEIALQRLQDAFAEAQSRAAASEDKLIHAERIAKEAERAAREGEHRHSLAREAIANAQGRVLAAQEKLAGLIDHMRQSLGEEPEDLPVRAGALLGSSLANGPLTDIEKRLDRLRSERDQAGPVNLRAEEERDEAQARLDGLLREKADVDGAIAKLKQAIGRLNGEGRTRLLAAFNQVNAHFAKLFETLFDGGQAELRLSESDDPLQAGLEIFACPPGKRLAALSLMSGGEQALTATALIFAVFLANPAPLCVLDEVDAPLDDANVDRYCRLLDEMRRLTDTRFLVITHNPVTMSRMDRLYGVTMAERGVSQIVSVDLRTAENLAAA